MYQTRNSKNKNTLSLVIINRLPLHLPMYFLKNYAWIYLRNKCETAGVAEGHSYSDDVINYLAAEVCLSAESLKSIPCSMPYVETHYSGVYSSEVPR